MAAAYGSMGTIGLIADGSDLQMDMGAPADIADGDLLVAIVASGAYANTCTISGFDVIATEANNRLRVFSKVASGESGAYTGIFTQAGNIGSGFVIRVPGGASVGNVAFGHDVAYDTHLLLGDIAVQNSDSCVIFAGTYPAVRANTVSSCTFDGATERYDNGSGNGVAAPLWIWTADSVAAQSITGKEFTMNSSFGGSGNKTGCSIEIVPAASPPAATGAAMAAIRQMI